MNNVQFRSNIILFFIITILFFVSISAFDPFISSYATTLGISPAVIGTIMGGTGLASLIFRFPLGVLSDVLNKRKVFIQVGLLITVVGWIIAFIEPNATTLYLGKFLDGITGSTWVIYTVMFASYFGPKNAAKAVALLTLADYVGALMGSAVGGIVAENFSYPHTFLVAVFAASIAFILIFFLKEQKAPVNKEKYDKKIIIEQITDKKLWVISLLAVIAQMALFGMRDTFTPLVARDLGADAIALSWLSNTYKISAGAAAALCGVFFYKKMGLVNTAVLGAFLQFVAAILIPFAPSLSLLFTLQALSGVAFALNFTVLMSLSIVNVPARKQSTRMGFFQSVYSFGIFFGPVMMGILTEAFSRNLSFLIIGILSAISGVLIKLYIKPKPIEKQNPRSEIGHDNTWEITKNSQVD
ncbi:putative MFS family arabinose efflux permease [Scopulibacillus darangshiensis]|uniref:Putative MFS family arabinose efflux permease n=1 Tax=Scopulibacillus darangshiensis TaxID=442528 RepID=A0A4R2P7N6_9BACL|nr:MFS transporter [Scopulibacillus darangshiensis]TCP30950.1 putative MFS family arabinose efflux permease [Scopulibacillus darangshiensis]